METQTTLSGSCIKIQVTEYQHYENSIGNNLQSIQITTKYRYHMMKKEVLKVECKVAIQEACKKHNIEINLGVISVPIAREISKDYSSLQLSHIN